MKNAIANSASGKWKQVNVCCLFIQTYDTQCKDDTLGYFVVKSFNNIKWIVRQKDNDVVTERDKLNTLLISKHVTK